jgi:hypothetical protein
VRGVVEKLPLQRLKLYSVYPFQVVYADWFDRLAAPIRFYYNGDDMAGWLTRAKLTHHKISPTGLSSKIIRSPRLTQAPPTDSSRAVKPANLKLRHSPLNPTRYSRPGDIEIVIEFRLSLLDFQPRIWLRNRQSSLGCPGDAAGGGSAHVMGTVARTAVATQVVSIIRCNKVVMERSSHCRSEGGTLGCHS